MYRTALLALVCALAAPAHDFWIQPSTHRAAPGEVVKVRLRVGEHLKGEAVRRNPERMEALFAEGPGGRRAIPGLDGSDPAGFFKAADPGAYVIAYQGRPARLELEASRFEAYLKEEGLEGVSRRRAELGQSAATGRERFIRCAKTLVGIGEARGGFDRELGLRLELVPETDPFDLKPGETFGLRVLFEGRALGGALVAARSALHPGVSIHARTDADGRLRLRLGDPGFWMLKTVHMVPSGAPDADWDSLWGSLSFELR